MQRTAKKKNCEAPTLESFFDEFTHTGTLNYCVVCLRTEQERKLTTSKTFKKFSACMKLQRNWKHNLVCYMCEKQAVNAYKFFKAATFAAAIDTMFAELMYQKKNKKIDVFQRTNFKHILAKLDLGVVGSLPRDWENELCAIRRRTKLHQTKPLTLDNLGFNTVSDSMTPGVVYVIPDDPPQDLQGHVTSISTRSCGMTTSFDTSNAPRSQKNLFRDPIMDVQAATDDSAILKSSVPTIKERLIIIDEDDPVQLRISKIESSADTPEETHLQSTSTPPLDPTDSSLMKYQTPKLRIPLENLLEKPKEIFTGDGLLIGGPDGNYTLHPIAIKEGVTTVPSLDAQLIDGKLILNTPHVNIQPTLHNSTVKDLVLSAIKPPPSKVYPNDPQKINSSPMMVTNGTLEVPKAVKRDGVKSVLSMATPSKRGRELPVTKVEADRGVRIDWEDKIPMDVISFMDAVDPNNPQHGILKQEKPKPTVYTEIIDLC